MNLNSKQQAFVELEDVFMRDKFDRYVSPQSRKELLEVWRTSAFFVQRFLKSS